MVRSTSVPSAAVRHGVRRAAALAATGTLAVLAAAGPALAQSAPAPAAGVTAVSGAVRAAQPLPLAPLARADVPAPTVPQTPPPCVHHYHHPGLVTSLLEGVGVLLSNLLGVLL